jgi:sarcosine oxidase subunit gamma
MNTLKSISALADNARSGRFETDGHCGVCISIPHPRRWLLIGSDAEKTADLTKRLKTGYKLKLPATGQSHRNKDYAIYWTGQTKWYVVSSAPDDAGFYETACKNLSPAARVCDQSHGRVTINLSGPHARDLLQKGLPVDLHDSVFAIGACAVTEIAHIAVHLVRTGQEEYQLSVYRSFAESIWNWLTEMSGEFGYEVIS